MCSFPCAAKKALTHLGMDNISEGVLWCLALR